MLAYFNGQFLAKDQISISPDDRGFLFADGLYEVIRSYEGRLFRLEAHLGRLSYGARQIRLRTSDFAFLGEVAERLIRENNLTPGDALIYMQVTRGVAPRQHRFPPPETPLTVYAAARSFTPKTSEQEEGIGVIFVPDVRWARTDIKSVGLLPNVLAQQQAVESGAAEAIFVRDGSLMEGTHSNVFAVVGAEVITPPRMPHILSGITRRIILELSMQLGIPCSERSISESEARRADELFITGTTVEITPVVKIDGQEVGTGKPGPITRRLQEAFRQEVKK